MAQLRQKLELISFNAWPIAVKEIADIVEGSFLVDGRTAAHITRAEVIRRTDVCAEFYLQLLSDLKWSQERIVDELPRALRCYLDGLPWEPARESRSTWAASEGSKIWLPD